MTYKQLVARVSYLLAGGRALEPIMGAPLINQALDMAINMVEPLTLIVQDASEYEKYKSLDDVYFIRKPKPAIEHPDEPIDIDDSLADMIVYLMAYVALGREKGAEKYLTNAMMVKDAYQSKNYKYLRDIDFYNTGVGGTFIPNCVRKDIPILLDDAGLLKYYIVRPDTGTNNWIRQWDQGAVDALDKFMLNPVGHNNFSKSTTKLWDSFCGVEDGEDAASVSEGLALNVLDSIFLDRSEGRFDGTKYYEGSCHCSFIKG